MGPTWVLSAPDGPHVGPMSFAIWELIVAEWRHMVSDTLVSIGSCNGLLYVRHQPITWTKADLLPIRSYRTYFNNSILKFLLIKCIWKCRLQTKKKYLQCIGWTFKQSNSREWFVCYDWRYAIWSTCIWFIFELYGIIQSIHMVLSC